MELGEHVRRYDCWVSGFWFGVVRSESALVGRICTSDAIDTVRDCAVCANAAFDTLQRRSDACWLAIGRNKVMYDVLDEDTLTLVVGK